jgi:hypothetical protein
MGIQLKNNAFTTLVSGISNTALSITVATGDGALFPTLGAGDYFYGTIVDASGVYEIVKVTARAGDSMTIVRAQEGTSAITFPTGSRFELRVTVENVLSKFNDLDFLLL